MSTFLGNTAAIVLLLNNVSASSDLNPNGRPSNASTDRALAASPMVTTAANTDTTPIDVSPALAAPGPAHHLSSFGDVFFERIHVLPKSATYPFILSTQVVTVEVWNAYRETTETVTAIVETGPAGVTITTPHGVPITFLPLQARYYAVEISNSGAPRADNSIRFDFSGIDEPLFTISGLRLIPFTISPDWATPIDDVSAYMTDVMTAYDETEQREMLRAVPNRAITYVAAALDDREAGLLVSLLWAWQDRSYGVLLWFDAMSLGADLASGSTVLNVDTTEMGLSVGSIVILISDAFTWFAGPVLTFDASSITLEAPTDRDFFARTALVIPVQLGRVADQIPVDRPNNVVAVTQIKFDLEVVDS